MLQEQAASLRLLRRRMLAVQDVVLNETPTSSDHLLNLTLDIDFSRFSHTVPVDDDMTDPLLVSFSWGVSSGSNADCVYTAWMGQRRGECSKAHSRRRSL